MQQSQIVHQKYDSVGFWPRQHISFARDDIAGFGKNALTGDGCCWYAQHGLCHRTKNQITGLMLCPPVHRTRWAAYRRLCHVLVEIQLHRVSLSRYHVSRSRSASRAELCPNRWLWQCCRIMCRSGGGVIAFHRRSRLLFAHDTYYGTNGRLTPFVGVECNQL